MYSCLSGTRTGTTRGLGICFRVLSGPSSNLAQPRSSGWRWRATATCTDKQPPLWPLDRAHERSVINCADFNSATAHPVHAHASGLLIRPNDSFRCALSSCCLPIRAAGFRAGPDWAAGGGPAWRVQCACGQSAQSERVIRYLLLHQDMENMRRVRTISKLPLSLSPCVAYALWSGQDGGGANSGAGALTPCHPCTHPWPPNFQTPLPSPSKLPLLNMPQSCVTSADHFLRGTSRSTPFFPGGAYDHVGFVISFIKKRKRAKQTRTTGRAVLCAEMDALPYPGFESS